MLKPMLAGAALLLSAQTPITSDEPAINYNAITMIQCGSTRGTAFWIRDTVLVTAEHVSSQGPCSIGGQPVAVTYEDMALDFAMIQGPHNSNHIEIDCRGPRRGRIYHAVGYAYGVRRHTSRLLATRKRYNLDEGNGLRVLLGRAYPGQSGGPVIGQNSRASAMVNRGGDDPPFMAGRSLSDTPLCQGRR